MFDARAMAGLDFPRFTPMGIRWTTRAGRRRGGLDYLDLKIRNSFDLRGVWRVGVDGRWWPCIGKPLDRTYTLSQKVAKPDRPRNRASRGDLEGGGRTTGIGGELVRYATYPTEGEAVERPRGVVVAEIAPEAVPEYLVYGEEAYCKRG
jgi:hypothetical protein